LPQRLHLVEFEGHLIDAIRQFANNRIVVEVIIEADTKISLGDFLQRLDDRPKYIQLGQPAFRPGNMSYAAEDDASEH